MAFLPHVVNGAQAAADPTLRSQLDTATQLRRRKTDAASLMLKTSEPKGPCPWSPVVSPR